MRTNVKEYIFIVGSPRSGTTFLADEVCARVDAPLFPEAQWIIEGLTDRAVGDYTLSSWQIAADTGRWRLACVEDIASYFRSEVNKRQVSLGNVILDHTPQNVLFLDDLKTLFSKSDCEMKLVAPLRHPAESIYSLATQSWFDKGLLFAAFYNFKCLFYLFRNRNQIKFFKVDDPLLKTKLDTAFGVKLKGCKHYQNFVVTDEKLLSSHRYFVGETAKRKHTHKNMALFLSVPALPLFWRLSARC